MFYHALKTGDQEMVKDIYTSVILPINRIRQQRKGYAVSLIKAGMNIMGHAVRNSARPPVVPVEKEHYQELESILRHAMERFPKKAAVN